MVYATAVEVQDPLVRLVEVQVAVVAGVVAVLMQEAVVVELVVLQAFLVLMIGLVQCKYITRKSLL